MTEAEDRGGSMSAPGQPGDALKLFLCGDVMIGRGIDQILAHPSAPRLYEVWAHSARQYVALAEAAHGAIPRPQGYDYPWGAAMEEWSSRRPNLRVINLETSITTSEAAWPKGINYRMHPRNVGCLAAAWVDCCVLANNHVLDWGREGLVETLDTLGAAGIACAGAGLNAQAAQAPAILRLGDSRRVLVFAAATGDSGVPAEWAAANHPGVSLLPDLSAGTRHRVCERIRAWRRASDVVLLSLHWGGNWGFEIAQAHRRFARALVDEGAVDLIHGHSSHHVKGFEVYKGRLILYGCGDFINDYEGIAGNTAYRGDLGLMYFPTLSRGGILHSLDLVPTRICHFRINRAQGADRDWLATTLQRECVRLDPALSIAYGDSFRWRSSTGIVG